MEKPTTKQIIDYYKDVRAAPGFLTSFATTRTFKGVELEMDVERDGEDVAVPLRTIGDAPNMNSDDYFTTRKMKPAPYKEAFALSAEEVDENRLPGSNPYESVSFQAKAAVRSVNAAGKLTKKIARSVELQAAQMYQFGVTDLLDLNGVTRFQADWPTDAGQFVGVGTGDWTDPTDPLIVENIGDFIQTIKDLGNTTDEFDLIMGRKAMRAWMANDFVQKVLDNRRINLGSFDRPSLSSSGGTRHGSFSVDGFNCDLWTYGGTYKLGGTRYSYVADNKIIVRAKDCETVLATAGIERFAGPDAQALQYVPSNLPGPFVVSPFATMSQDKTALEISVGSRSVHYPRTVNKFGCFTTDAV